MAEIKKGARIIGATRDKLATDLKKRYEGGDSNGQQKGPPASPNA